MLTCCIPPSSRILLHCERFSSWQDKEKNQEKIQTVQGKIAKIDTEISQVKERRDEFQVELLLHCVALERRHCLSWSCARG